MANKKKSNQEIFIELLNVMPEKQLLKYKFNLNEKTQSTILVGASYENIQATFLEDLLLYGNDLLIENIFNKGLYNKDMSSKELEDNANTLLSFLYWTDNEKKEHLIFNF